MFKCVVAGLTVGLLNVPLFNNCIVSVVPPEISRWVVDGGLVLFGNLFSNFESCHPGVCKLELFVRGEGLSSIILALHYHNISFSSVDGG